MAYLLRVHVLEEPFPVFLVELHQHVSLLLIVFDEVEEPFRLPEVERTEKLRDVGGMHLTQLVARRRRVGGLDESPDALYVVVVGFLHILSSIKSYGQIKRQVAYVFEPFALHQHFKQFF